MFVCMYVSMYVCVRVICVCVYIYVCVRMYVCVLCLCVRVMCVCERDSEVMYEGGEIVRVYVLKNHH